VVNVVVAVVVGHVVVVGRHHDLCLGWVVHRWCHVLDSDPSH